MSTVLHIQDLKLVRGTRAILNDVDLEVTRGELVVLMGLSGSGKTTILRSVAGLEAPSGGRIVVDGLTVEAGERRPHELHRKVGMVFQFHCLFEHLTARHNVWLAPVHVYRADRAASETRAQALLDSLGAGHRGEALPRELSGGEAQRVAIARALATDPPLLLMDEPTASLDPARRNELGDTLTALAASGRSLLLTSHDDDFVRDFATRVVVLHNGEVVESGPPGEVLVDPQHEATQRLLQVERSKKR
jgi:polar amino acid transport system ATP-binding protein